MTASVPGMRELLARPAPLLALAPMGDVTDAAVWRLLGRRGHPDAYVTDHIRVHAASSLDEASLLALVEAADGRIGHSILRSHRPGRRRP